MAATVSSSVIQPLFGQYSDRRSLACLIPIVPLLGGLGIALVFFFFPAEDGIRDRNVTGVQTCALPISEVVDGQHVGPAEAEDQKHFDGPNTDASDGDEPLDERFVGHLVSLFESGDDARQGFAGEVFHRENLGTRETRLAEDRRAELEHCRWRGRAAVAAEGLDAAEDGGGGFSGDGLIRDGFEERFVGGTRFLNLESESGSLVDQTFETFVPFGEALHGCGEVEGKRWGLCSHAGGLVSLCLDRTVCEDARSTGGRRRSDRRRRYLYATAALAVDVSGITRVSRNPTCLHHTAKSAPVKSKASPNSISMLSDIMSPKAFSRRASSIRCSIATNAPPAGSAS